MEWTDAVPEDQVKDIWELARTYRRDADETTRNLELKAARLATVLVALLTANVALLVYELTRLGPNPSTIRLILVASGTALGVLAAGWLVIALTRAVDADQRMGITTVSTLKDVAHDARRAMRDEVHGHRVSNWTRRNKATRLINARAAVSRSMVCLVASAAIAVGLALDTTLSPAQDNRVGPTHLHLRPPHGRHAPIHPFIPGNQSGASN